jgi:hypothetical protein
MLPDTGFHKGGKCMKKRTLIASVAVVVILMLLLPYKQSGYCDDKISFAVIFLGGPDTGAEGEKIIEQFIGSLTKLTGLKKSTLQGKYFNNIISAKTYIRQHKNSYIMGSLGFFLANRQEMNLVPLAVVKINGKDEERYYLIAEKGKYKSLADLKGKVLAGNILYEDVTFINRMIFGDTIDVKRYFRLKPTGRPLSAIRKLVHGEYDAVLLNSTQYNNLRKLSYFGKIQIMYESQQMPALGLMMINTARDNSIKSKIVEAVSRMCDQIDTREACSNFGIQGFAPVNAELINNEIKQYESSR